MAAIGASAADVASTRSEWYAWRRACSHSAVVSGPFSPTPRSRRRRGRGRGGGRPHGDGRLCAGRGVPAWPPPPRGGRRRRVTVGEGRLEVGEVTERSRDAGMSVSSSRPPGPARPRGSLSWGRRRRPRRAAPWRRRRTRRRRGIQPLACPAAERWVTVSVPPSAARNTASVATRAMRAAGAIASPRSPRAPRPFHHSCTS